MRFLRDPKLFEGLAIAFFALILLYFLVTGVMSYAVLDASWPYPQH